MACALTMFCATLKDLVAEWAYKPTFRHNRVSSMLSFMVLVHGLSTSKQFPAHRTCSPLTMSTRLGVFSPVPPCRQAPSHTYHMGTSHPGGHPYELEPYGGS